LDARGMRRSGPRLPATKLSIRPVVASEGASLAEVDAILAHLASAYETNSTLVLEVLPPELANASLARVPADFGHPAVVELLEHGDADAVNVIFVDRVTGV